MPEVLYSQKSQAAFDTLDPRLQQVLLYVKNVLRIDHSVLEGHRDKETQDKYFFAKPPRTQIRWPNGKHNTFPSLAVDVVPYVKLPDRAGGVHWRDKDNAIRESYFREMVRFATTVQLVALLKFGTVLRWGGDWDRDWSVMDNRFNDYPHLEIVED